MEAKVKRSLDVFWDGRIVGRYDLLEDDSELFSYDSGYLESPDAAPISSRPYSGRHLRPLLQ